MAVLYKRHLWRCENQQLLSNRKYSIVHKTNFKIYDIVMESVLNLFAGMSSSFTSSGAANYPGLRAKGPSKVQKGASRRGISTTEPLDRGSSNITSTRKASSGVKSAFMIDLPVDDDHKCAICLGRINQEKKLRCKHSFCRKCVDRALKVHKYCPICKQPVQ